ARLGVVFEGTPCDELASRLGRPAAFLVGLTIFLVAAGFQTSNNLAVIKALAPYFDPEASPALARWAPIAAVVALNLFLVAVVYISRNLYRPIEKAMKALVLLMVIAFLVNAIVTRPSIAQAIAGLVPRLPADTTGATGLFALVGLAATTFSIAGAFYQAYLVRDKGWTLDDLRAGLVDSLVGVAVLGGITLTIMLTAAAQFHGKVDPDTLTTVTDVAAVLQNLFGPWAGLVFTVGIFAGALSSFLVNAMIGGQFLADGTGRGASIDKPATRHFTVAALAAGLAGALVAQLSTSATGGASITPIIIAQACTVIGGPALAATLLYLATRPDLTGEKRTPKWLLASTVAALLVTLVLATKTIIKLAS
ncbi:MAG: divalent metal cation transporter, partial [Verrucomicrobiales bacterium]|nr:divalent metal cation transporter [Verrucomicrobiales bacterium]